MEEWTLQGKAALILIHMQHAITDPQGTVGFLHAKAAWESGIIPKQQALLKAFREKNLPIFYVNSVHPADASQRLPRYGRFYEAIRGKHFNEAGTKDVEVLSAVANLPGEPVLGNYPAGLFTGNDLKQRLDDLGVDTLVLAGVATGVVMTSAVFSATDFGYSLIVPSDASIDADREIQNVVMNRLIPAIALVTTSDDVIAHL